MIVFAKQLIGAAEEMRSRGINLGTLKEPVKVTPEQLATAGRIIAEGPQPIANGMKADMPGFIEADQQESEDVLLLTVGILPSREFRIARDGEVLGCPCVGTPDEENCPHA